jgi:hypothetical protein
VRARRIRALAEAAAEDLSNALRAVEAYLRAGAATYDPDLAARVAAALSEGLAS